MRLAHRCSAGLAILAALATQGGCDGAGRALAPADPAAEPAASAPAPTTPAEPAAVDGDPPATPAPPAVPAFALRGDAMHLYRAHVTLGGAGPFALLVDTGSSALAVAATSCRSCNGRSPTYTPGATAKAIAGPVAVTYGCGIGFQGEGSTGWSGQRYQETVSLGADATVTMAVNAITDGDPFGVAFPMFTCMDDGVANSAQGIIGMRTGSGGAASFLGARAAQGGSVDSFAVQLCDIDGRLWLGTWDPGLATGAPVYTPFTDPGAYAIGLLDVRLGGQSLGVPASAYGTVVVDTGTGRLTLPSTPFAALSRALQANAAWTQRFGASFLGGSRCVAAADGSDAAALDAALPPLTIQLPRQGGGTLALALPATASYLAAEIGAGGRTGAWCPGIEAGGAGSIGQLTIVGNSVMHRHILIFDRAQRRLGFAPLASCTGP